MHDRMFNNGNKLTGDNILAWAKKIDVDMPKFIKDMDSKETAAEVDRDVKEGDDIGVLGTPTGVSERQALQRRIDRRRFRQGD